MQMPWDVSLIMRHGMLLASSLLWYHFFHMYLYSALYGISAYILYIIQLGSVQFLSNMYSQVNNLVKILIVL